MDEIKKVKKIDGRSKEARAMRAAPSAQERAAIAAAAKRPLEPPENLVEDAVETPFVRKVRSRVEVREPTREATRSTTGRRVIEGRNGETLTRKRVGGIDPFHIEPSIIPDGWEYQWNAISVVGNTEILADQNMQMAENGWRPVPSSRHPGRYMPAGHSGAILRGGLRLDERPKALSDEARAEDLANARQLITDRNDALQLTSFRGKLPDGFEMGGGRRGTGGNVRMSIDPALDIPRPSHPKGE